MHALHDVSASAARAMSIDWEVAYASHAAELTGYLARLSGDPDTANELMQETFVRGMRGQATIREPEAIRAWLYRTATNLAHNHRRRRAVLRFIPFTGAEHASARDSFDPEADQVRRALGSIGTKTAATLLLFYVNGFSRAEIAGMLDISEETVKSRLARGRHDFMAAYGRLEKGLAR